MTHYQVEEADMPSGMMTALSRVCMACGEGIAPGGGGGDYLCQTCFYTLRRGPWRGNLRKLRDAPKADLCTLIDLL